MKGTISSFVIVALLATFSNGQWTPSPYCPFPSEDLTRSPYEGDCTKYWECYEGARYVMTCPQGLEFSEKDKRCELPEKAQCNQGETITYPTYPHSVDPDQSTLTTSVWTPDPLCPYPSADIVFFVYPYNCSQYWECYEGNKYLMTCPVGLVWNEDASVCDYKANVDCNHISSSSGTTSSSGTGTTASPASTTSSPGTSAPPTSVSPSTAGPTGTTVTAAPSVCEGHADNSFVPNDSDCNKFYECVGGIAIAQNCPSGLYWNQDAGRCDFPYNVECKVNN